MLFFRPNDLSLYWTNTYSHYHLFFLGDNGGLSSTVDEEVDDVKEPETETNMNRVTLAVSVSRTPSIVKGYKSLSLVWSK